ncbi:MAG TPA: hypothetical protein PLW02_08865 [Verrucomicrobiota bacterium]|nr:hypothetical protein [Verrucomicrobiota bacterium]
MNEWKIQSRSHICQACGKSFEDKQVYHTLLFEQKNELIRLDLCDVCWQSQYNKKTDGKREFVSYWQGIYEAPPPAPPEPIKRETAETLLRKLIELNDPKYIAPAFILAVMLERKRILKVKQEVINDGRRVFIYEHSRTGDVFSITDPRIDDSQIEEVQKTVAYLLESGVPEAQEQTNQDKQSIENKNIGEANLENNTALSSEQIQ